MRCSVCQREFDELGYQLFVPARAESFDTYECAARAQGLPSLGLPVRGDELPPFERPLAPAAAASSRVASAFARARARAALAAAAAFAVAVGGASAFAWLRDEPREGAGHPAASNAESAPTAETTPSPSREEGAEGSRLSPPAQPGRSEAGRPADREAPRSAGDAPDSPRADPAASDSKGERASPGSGTERRARPPAPPPRGPRPSPPLAPSRPPAPSPPPPAAQPPPVAVPASPETRPGWGHGDKNHAHEGPPGAGGTGARPAKKPRAPRRRR